MKGTFHKRIIVRMILITILIVYFAVICLINFSSAPSMYEGDMYCDYRYAAEVWEHKSIFPDGWVFGNQLNAVSTPVLAGVLYGIIHNMNLSMALACTVMAIFTIICFDWMIKPVNKTPESRLLAIVTFVTIVLYCGRAVYGNAGWTLFFTMCSYYSGYSITAFLAFGCYIRSLKGFSKTDWLIFMLACILSFGTGIQSIRQTVIMIVPIAVVEFLRLITVCRKKSDHRGPIWVAAGIAVSNFFGLAFVRLVEINQHQIFDKIEITPLPEIFTAIMDCFWMLVTLLSNGTQECFVVMAIVFFLCVMALLHHGKPFLKEWNTETLALLILLGMSFAVIIGIDVATTMYVRPRYYFMLYPTIAYLVAYLYEHREKGRTIILVFVTALFCAACIRELPDVCRQAWNSSEEESYEVSRYLLENGYSTVYSTWEHGEDYAIASEGEIIVAYWDNASDPFVPAPYLCSMKDYEADPDTCVYLFEGQKAAEIGIQKAQQKNVEMTLLRYLQNSDTYIYTATENLLQLYQ